MESLARQSRWWLREKGTSVLALVTGFVAMAFRSGSRICGAGRKPSLRALGRSAAMQGQLVAGSKVTCTG